MRRVPKRECIKEKKKWGGIHQPLYGTWVADFTPRQDAERFIRDDKKITWQRRRRLGMVAGNTPTATFLTKIGKMQSAGCRLFNCDFYTNLKKLDVQD